MADWSAALAEAYSSAPADDFVISTLELLHPAFVDSEDNADSIRIALDNREWDLTYEEDAPLFAGQTKTFEPLAMQITLPEQSESSFGTLNLSLDNVPRTIWPKLQLAAKVRASAMVIYREWVAVRDTGTGVYSVANAPDMIINQLTMRMVTATQLRLEGSATFVDLLNKAFPRRTFSREDFPGLFGGA
jgi:Domain of unknown function (DUF1833)